MKVNGVQLGDKERSYLTTILWAETVSLPCEENNLVDNFMGVDEDHPLHDVMDCSPLDDHFTFGNFTDVSLHKAVADLNDWFDHLANTEFKDGESLLDITLEYEDEEHIAHDFWLTRNGHGVGYWNGDYGDELGKALTAACKSWPEQYVLVDEEGWLYLEDC